jgi:hypothetical protein
MAVGQRLEQAFKHQFVDNPEVREAFDGLAFEIGRARGGRATPVGLNRAST